MPKYQQRQGSKVVWVQVVQAYRFALDPTFEQVRMLNSHAGAARFAYNQMLALVLANWNQRTAEKTYGIEAEQLTPGLDWSFYALRKEWNHRKPELAPWWKENSKESYATVSSGSLRRCRTGPIRARETVPAQ